MKKTLRMVLYWDPFNLSVFSSPWVFALPRLDLSRLLKRYITARTGRMRRSNFRVKARSAAGLMIARVAIGGHYLFSWIDAGALVRFVYQD